VAYFSYMRSRRVLCFFEFSLSKRAVLIYVCFRGMIMRSK